MTLTQAAKFTRIFIIFFIATILLSITAFVSYRIWYARYLSSLPPVEIKPDPKYGVLQPPSFPESKVSSSNYSYTLATTTGDLPAFPAISKVYIMPPKSQSLLAGEKSQELASKFNITSDPKIISDTEYKYSNPTSILNINLDTGNFDFTNEASATAQVMIQDNEDKISSDFKFLLNKLGVLNDDLKNGATKITFTDDSRQAAQVALWPQNIDEMKILTANSKNSLISGVFTNNARDIGNYTSLNYIYWPVDTTTFATYPIKSSQQAYNDLLGGKGAVITQPQNPQVSLTNITLAYYQTDTYTPYLQPIYVFEGPGFLAYVPAITDQYLNFAK